MTFKLLRIRLHWYALATGRLVLRRWQGLLLALAVLAPAGASALSQAETLGWPLLVLLSPDRGPLQRYALLCLYQALALVWALMQRDQIRGGEFMGYATSLPLSPWRMRTVDLLVLLAANSPLFLVPAAALAWLFAQDAVPALPNVVLLAHLLVLAVVAQSACLERAYGRLLAIALANLPLALVPDAGATVQPVLLAAVLPCAWLAAACLSGARFKPLLGIVRRASLALVSRAVPASAHPAAFIPLHFLMREAPAKALGKLALAAAVTAAACALMALWEYDERIAVLSVIALSLVALAISGLYRDLQMAHRAAQPLVAALPLPWHWASKFDHAVLMLAAAPFAALICATVAVHRPQWLVSMLLLALAFFGLIGMLRLPQVHAERQTVVLSSLIAALWGIASAAALF